MILGKQLPGGTDSVKCGLGGKIVFDRTAVMISFIIINDNTILDSKGVWMSKAHMIVLSFVGTQPMHGYQIGQLVEQYDLPHWTGITLPSIYKAMQSLERSDYIRGVEMREGNNPPRKVYHLTPGGKRYLQRIVCGYLGEFRSQDLDWWMALFFAAKTMRRSEMVSLLEDRIGKLKQAIRFKQSQLNKGEQPGSEILPFVYSHLLALGIRFIRAELKTLQELVAEIDSGARDDFFIGEGDDK
jgi:DNA-binding PadR family transcriptional regulator